MQQLICTFSDIKGAHCQQPIFLCNLRCLQRDGVHMERRCRNASDRSTGYVFHTLECPFARCVRSALMSLDGILLQVSFSTIRRFVVFFAVIEYFLVTLLHDFCGREPSLSMTNVVWTNRAAIEMSARKFCRACDKSAHGIMRKPFCRTSG